LKAGLYQAIRTRFHGATETRGSRITARAEAGSVTVSYDYSLNGSENHARAAQALVDKFGWGKPHYGEYVGGVFGNDYYWVAVPEEESS